MEALDDAQLVLERVARNVKDHRHIFGADHAEIGRVIGEAERYVGHVIDDWEKHGRHVRTGANLADVIQPLENLRGFLGSAKATTGMKIPLSNRVHDAAERIQALRFEVDPAITSRSATREASG